MAREGLSPFSTGVVLLILGALSVQLGAAIGTSVIPSLGVIGIVLARYVVQACVHVPFAWRHLRTGPTRAWWWAVVVALPLLGMNTAIYLAFSRIGVGLSVTIELLGPIAVAVLTAKSFVGWFCAGLAAAGMILVTGPSGSANATGVLWACVAAASWAFYLLAVRKAGEQLPGLAPTAIASVLGLFVLVPTHLLANRNIEVTSAALGLALLAGLLSSALPYACDVLALRHVPIDVASTMMSLNPVTAVFWGVVILGERLGPAEIIGLVVISLANIWVVRASRRPRYQSQ